MPHRPGCRTDGNDSNIMVFALPDDVCKCQCMWLSLAIHHHHLLVVLDRPAQILHLWCSVKSSGDVLFSHLSKPLNMAKLNFTSSPLPLHLYSHRPTIPPLFSSHIHTISISFPECSSIFPPTFVVPLMPCFIFCQALALDIPCSVVPSAKSNFFPVAFVTYIWFLVWTNHHLPKERKQMLFSHKYTDLALIFLD